MGTRMNQQNSFYVYILFNARGLPRYVGKGRGRRWNDHERSIDKHNRAKNGFIRRTLAALGEIPKIKVRENLSEAEAFATEIVLIAAIGRLDLKTGPLTNMSAGGTGGNFSEAIKRAKAKWTPEERAKHAQTYRESTLRNWAHLTKEEQDIRRAKASSASIEKLRLTRQADPNFDIKRGKSISAGYAKRTAEDKALTIKKRLTSTTHEKRSLPIKRMWDHLNSEERRARQIGASTSEQRSERGRRANAALSPSERSDRVRNQQASLTLEQQIKRADRAHKLGAGTRWITNEQNNKRLKDQEQLPDGWRYGRKPNKAASISPHAESSSAASPTIAPGTLPFGIKATC